MDDCRSKEDQEKFVKGLEAFEAFTKEKNGKSFMKSSMAERAGILEQMESNKEVKDDKSFFYGSMKRYTIQAYTSSEFYLTKVQVYEMVPSRWHGCVPVNKSA